MPNENKDIGQLGTFSMLTSSISVRNFIFAIGINNYYHCRRLNNAVKDVRDVVHLLTTKYQFEAKNITFLENGMATRANILKQLNHYTNTLTEGDTLFIYFSGHGDLQKNIEEGSWVPVEGNCEDLGSFIPNSTITKYLRSIKARHIVVVSDACFSGTLITEKSVTALDRQESIPSRWLLSSGRAEVVDDGVPGENSPFASSILRHLRANHRPVWRLTNLADFVLEEVGNNNAQLPLCQPLQDVRHRGGEFMFRLKGHAEEVPPIIPIKDSLHNLQRGNSLLPTSVPRPILKNPLFWIGAAFFTALLGWFIFNFLFSVSETTSVLPTIVRQPKVSPYHIVGNGGEDLLIVRQKDTGLKGYVYARDSSLAILCKFDDVDPFDQDIARVKLNNKYGWIRADGSFIINAIYDYAEKTEINRAKVILGEETYLIDLTTGDKIKAPVANAKKGVANAKKDSNSDRRVATKEDIKPVIEPNDPKPERTTTIRFKSHGINGIQVSFTVNGKPYSGESKTGQDIAIEIPQSLLRKTISVEIKRGTLSVPRSISFSDTKTFDIPEIIWNQ